MYRAPLAEYLFPESEEVMNADLFASKEEDEETDNNVKVEDLLDGLK